MPLLTLHDVESFATEQIETPVASDQAVAVLVAANDGRDETRAVLRTLVDHEKCSADHELRKWRVVLLKHALTRLPSDPLHGLVALTEFWERFDFPLDSPHIVQGRGNTASPPDYYKEQNYRALVTKHLEWIDVETSALREPPGWIESLIEAPVPGEDP